MRLRDFLEVAIAVTAIFAGFGIGRGVSAKIFG